MRSKSVPDIRFAGFDGEWEERKLKEVSTYSNGGSYENDVLKEGKYELVTLKSVDMNGNLVSSGKYIDLEVPTLKKGTLVMILSEQSPGLLGMTAQIPESNKYVLNQRVAEVLPNDDIYEYFLSMAININQQYFSKRGAGTKVQNISKPNVENYEFFVPCFKEQTQVGNFFKQLDEAIALQQQELDTLKQTKQGFLQKMFPKEEESVPEVRFPGFTGDWEQRKLGEIMDVTSVKRIHQSDWTDKGVRFLRARDIVAASKNEEPRDYLYISVDKYYEYSKVSGKVSQGDLLVTGVGSIGVPMLVTDDEPIYFKDGNIIWFKNEHRIEGDFFYYSFNNNNIQKYIRDVAGIGTVGTYTIDSGKKTPISLPSFEEQTKIGNFFKQLDGTIALHQRELDALKETKKAFLQKMFA